MIIIVKNQSDSDKINKLIKEGMVKTDEKTLPDGTKEVTLAESFNIVGWMKGLRDLSYIMRKIENN